MSLQFTEIRKLHYTISTAIGEKHYLRRRQREIQERKPCKTAEDTTTPQPETGILRMSQSAGGGSERHHHSEQNKMAAAYTGGYPAPSSQTLPSFRELLPEHLHDEIDQAAYYITQQSRSTDRNHTSNAVNSYGKSRPSLPFLSASGLNPILPPLRDLQSSPRHHQQSDRSIRSLDEVPSRSDSRAGRGYGSSQISKDEDHRHHSAAGGGVSNTYGTHMSYDASRYSTQQQQQQHQSQLSSRSPYQGTSYANSNHSNQSNDYEYSVPASSPPSGHGHTTTPTSSNFGVMGSDQLDSRGKRRRGNLPKPVTDVLRSWFHEHLDHPYPTEEDKQVFMSRTGLSLSQISNWFINARRRQLPALRNQLRNTDGDHIPRSNSPLSDGEASTSPPHSHQSRSPTHSRHK